MVYGFKFNRVRFSLKVWEGVYDKKLPFDGISTSAGFTLTGVVGIFQSILKNK